MLKFPSKIKKDRLETILHEVETWVPGSDVRPPLDPCIYLAWLA